MFPTLNSSMYHCKRVQCDVMRAELNNGPNVFCQISVFYPLLALTSVFSLTVIGAYKTQNN